mmetsp:Transcript_11652/g.49030  ORF Transcript_11652/g.49030 Transcript_11652/m.49030 type:complete len:326 (+) Transcript_11652:975-1952(+)
MGVARGGHHGEHAVLDGQQRHVEGAAAQVENEHLLRDALGLVEAVRERGGRRLVDDTKHVEAGDGARVLGEAALRVVEVRGHRDHRLGDLGVERHLGGLLHLLEHHGAHLLGHELEVLRLLALARGHADDGLARLALLDLEGHAAGVLVALAELPADDALDVEEGARRVARGLVLGALADEALAGGVGERHPRGGGARTEVVREDLGLAVAPHGNAREGRAQVNANHVLGGGRGVRSGGAVGDLRRGGLGGDGVHARLVRAALGQARRERLVLRVLREAGLVRRHRAHVVARTEERQAQAPVALGPLRRQLDALAAVLHGRLEVA